MNGNLIFHAPLIPAAAQRGSLGLNTFLGANAKDWQAVCSPGTNNTIQCNWRKGGGSVDLRGDFGLTVHRTTDREFTGSSGVTTFEAYGYTLVTADGATHALHGVSGTEDLNGEPREFDSVDLSGFHLSLSGNDSDLPSTATVTSRSGDVYQ